MLGDECRLGPLNVPKEKKPQGDKSGDFGGQVMSPRKEKRCLGNIYLKILSERRELCAVTPSCWNQTSSSFLVN
jgi:hypothetical protein